MEDVAMIHGIISECYDAFMAAIEEDHAQNGEDSISAVTKVDTNDGYIELYIDRYGAQASVIHDDESKNGREMTNFETVICENAPTWWDAEEEEDSGVDEGFADYADYLNYMYR